MRLLDLFCGAGGAAVGYYRAGFTEIVGVDITPQKNYPYQFIQGNAMAFLAKYGHEFDVIHASPVCKRYSVITKAENRDNHPDYIQPLRRLLQWVDKPYVIENVSGAVRLLHNPIMLCGAMFGLKVYRHRFFEIAPYFLLSPPHAPHRDKTPPAGHGKSPKGFISVTSGGGGMGKGGADYMRAAMGIDWMNMYEVGQAIPPAFTEYIGRQLLPHLNVVTTQLVREVE